MRAVDVLLVTPAENLQDAAARPVLPTKSMLNAHVPSCGHPIANMVGYGTRQARATACFAGCRELAWPATANRSVIGALRTLVAADVVGCEPCEPSVANENGCEAPDGVHSRYVLPRKQELVLSIQLSSLSGSIRL